MPLSRMPPTWHTAPFHILFPELSLNSIFQQGMDGLAILEHLSQDPDRPSVGGNSTKRVFPGFKRAPSAHLL